MFVYSRVQVICANRTSSLKYYTGYSQCLPGTGGGGGGPTTTTTPSGGATTTSSGGGSGATPPADDPYSGYQIYLSPYYADEISKSVASISDATLAKKAAQVANIPTFTWCVLRSSKGNDLNTYSLSS